MSSTHRSTSVLKKGSHAQHCKRCLLGLPASLTLADASRLAIGFYCIGSLDLLGLIDEKTTEVDREEWKEWVWDQYSKGRYGSGFRPGPFMTTEKYEEHSEYDVPHIIMTYTALISLAVLRDDFLRLDRVGLAHLLRTCQQDDGSFSTIPNSTDSDLRNVYCAFAICSLIGDWSAIDVKRAVNFIGSCRTYEGGYGQTPYNEAQGGTTYTALASLHLIPQEVLSTQGITLMTNLERQQTIRWLIQQQTALGGFSGRTGKEADACYCFWCSASLQILGVSDLTNSSAMVKFIDECQFKYGGISKALDEHPDPYHTYLSLAALAIGIPQPDSDSSWHLERLDPLLNARQSTSQWLKRHLENRGKY